MTYTPPWASAEQPQYPPPTDAPARTYDRADLASPWQRLGAVIIDGLILGIPLMIVMIAWLANDTDFTESGAIGTLPPWFYLFAFFGAIYQVVGIALWGQTLGKHILGIRVTAVEDLSRPGWLKSLIRWGVFALVGWIPYVGWLISLAIILPLIWTLKHQGLHDKAAGTIVLRNAAVPWA